MMENTISIRKFKRVNKLSVVIGAGNNHEIFDKCLESIKWADEVIIVFSKGTYLSTFSIASKYTKHIYYSENNLGLQRKYGIKQAKNNWILILDTDEILSEELKHEIISTISETNKNGFFIPFQGYFLNHLLRQGNQVYKKKRLFRKDKGEIQNLKVHPEIIIEEPVGTMNGKIHHYSFRSVGQTLKKFTYYAKSEAPVLFEKGERVTLKKLTMYPAHMFWAILIKDEGWKDGIWGLGLALCFTYYEFARYFYLLLELMKKQNTFKKIT